MLKNKTNFIINLILIFQMILFSISAFALQPYENNFGEIEQGPSQCGPTSFYMVFNYYGDQGYYTTKDCKTEVDLSDTLEIVTDKSKICEWINGGTTYGTSWTQLKEAALNLYQNCVPYYKVELNDNFTEYNDEAGEEERRFRFAYIKENYLVNNRPVIIHLRRYWWLSGHYIVITGYDEENQLVHYADPNEAYSGTVSFVDFIENKWYESPDNSSSWYRARWDGEWMGFY